MSADADPHQVGEYVVGPNNEDVGQNHPGIPATLPRQQRQIGHHRQRHGHIKDTSERRPHIGGGAGTLEEQFADEHQWYEQNKNRQQPQEDGKRSRQQRHLLRRNRQQETRHEKSRTRNQSEPFERVNILPAGHPVKLPHTADENRQQQHSETPLRPKHRSDYHDSQDGTAQGSHQKIPHFIRHNSTFFG